MTMTMTNALQTTSQDQSRADIFFDIEPVVTDWDAIRKTVVDGKITSEEMLTVIKSYEPMEVPGTRGHAHWVSQQMLRLALLHKAGKNLESDKICERCASRKADALFAEKWNCLCLHCQEAERQETDTGSRASCEFLKPCYNPRSRSWGLLYYWSHGGGDSRFLFWLADFFKTREATAAALRPIARYSAWLDRKYGGLYSSWRDFSDLLPIDSVMKLSLPLTPEQFREHLRTAIEIEMNQEHQLMNHCVREAMRKHERKEDDDD